MTKKRNAEFQLTDRNWDQEEEESEEAGLFIAADDSEISKRVIKKAKRRTTEGSSENTTKKPFSAFSGFSGFGTKPMASGGFSLLSASSSNSKPIPSFSLKPVTETAPKSISFANPDKQEMSTAATASKSGSNNMDKSYVNKLTSLNVGVLAWIKEHVDKNPCLDLSPVFDDYKKHLETIKKDFPGSSTQPEDRETNTTPSTSNETPKSDNVTFNFGGFTSTPVTSSAKDTDAPKPAKFESFFSKASTSTPFFNPVKALTTDTGPAVTSNKRERENNNSDDDEDESPDVEEKEVVTEEDAFHTVRTKLFFKSGSVWRELGLGMLYLKEVNSRIQLLVRMETSTGKILLNISLTKGMPVSRSGKNNVMLVCVPNPPVFVKAADGDNSKPVPYLIRVKGAEEADALHKMIQDKLDA